MSSIQTQLPADAANTFFTALNEQRWDDAANWVEPLWLLRWWHGHFAALCAGLQEREAARHEGREMASFGSDGILRPELLVKYADEVLQFYPGSPTFRELAALLPTAYLALLLRQMHRRQRRQQGTALSIVYRVLAVNAEGTVWKATYVRGRTDPSLQDDMYRSYGSIRIVATPPGWRIELTDFPVRRPPFPRNPGPS